MARHKIDRRKSERVHLEKKLLAAPPLVDQACRNVFGRAAPEGRTIKVG